MGGWQKYLQKKREKQSHIPAGFLYSTIWWVLPNEHLWAEAISKRLLQLMDAGVVKPESMDDNNSVFLVQRI